MLELFQTLTNRLRQAGKWGEKRVMLIENINKKKKKKMYLKVLKCKMATTFSKVKKKNI